MINFIDPLAQLMGDWSAQLNIYSVLIRIALSIIFASLIGYERANKRHSAGLRTFILTSFTACVAMIIDFIIFEKTEVKIPVISCVSVISAAILSGNSILFSSRNQIKGLTTSIGLWSCSILGLITGMGLYLVSIICFVFLFITLKYMPQIEMYLKDKSNHFEVHLELKRKECLQDFITTIRKLGLKIDDIEANNVYIGSGLSVYTITLTIKSEELKKYKSHFEIIEALKSLDYIYFIEEIA